MKCQEEEYSQGADILLLREFIRKQTPDKELGWEEIEEATGVEMNEKGKNRFRSACKSESIEYASVRGVGVVLAGPGSGVRILRGRLQGAKNSIIRSHTCYGHIAESHLRDMDTEDQKKVIFVGACFAAMLNASNQINQRPIEDVIRPGQIQPSLDNI